jgi:hypothetical protein
LSARAPARSHKALSALGVFAAVVLAVNANVLVSRWYTRWDVTSEGLYTLSHATKATLAALKDPIELVVLLTRDDPLLPRVRQMLTAYAAETTRLDVRYVDPERNPAEFAAVQERYRILTGRTADDKVVTDAVIVIARGDRSWFVTADDVTSFDDEGRARPELEQALTEGIANVLSNERAVLCFSEGHQEASLDDVGPDGLAELRHRLEKNNFDVEAVNLEQPDAERALARCRALTIVGPEVPFSKEAAGRAVRYVQQGGSVAIFASARVGSEGVVKETGLEPIAALAGIELGHDIVLEADPSARLPRGAGEVFFAEPRAHEITNGLVRDTKVDFRVLLSQAQSLTLGPTSSAKELLLSSDQALAIADLSPLLAGKPIPEDKKPAIRVLGAAHELPKPGGSQEKHGPRLVVVGATNPPVNRSFRDAALIGDRLFAENALAWLSARPALVSVPRKSAHEVGLALTEDALGEVFRYVLIYMPAVSALLGVLLMLDRRKREKASREAARAREASK